MIATCAGCATVRVCWIISSPIRTCIPIAHRQRPALVRVGRRVWGGPDAGHDRASLHRVQPPPCKRLLPSPEHATHSGSCKRKKGGMMMAMMMA
eukprot:1921402-Rhodomonas_salina.3